MIFFAIRLLALFALLMGTASATPLATATPFRDTEPVGKRNTLPLDIHSLSPGGEFSLSTRWLSRPEERIMTLTFDDGPEELDLAIAALLKQYHVPATFFYLGQKVEARPEIVEELLSAGHEIGYHSYRHQRLSLFSPTRLSDDFRDGVAAFHNLGILLTWFRPPYGEFNEQVITTAKTAGMETILWSIDSRDWTGIDANTLADKVIRRFHPGAILLFHSTQPTVLQALPAVLEAAMQKNYRLVSLTNWRTIVQAANGRMEAKYQEPVIPPVQAPAPAPCTTPTPPLFESWPGCE